MMSVQRCGQAQLALIMKGAYPQILKLLSFVWKAHELVVSIYIYGRHVQRVSKYQDSFGAMPSYQQEKPKTLPAQHDR